jgi:DICT domain-containing protein
MLQPTRHAARSRPQRALGTSAHQFVGGELGDRSQQSGSLRNVDFGKRDRQLVERRALTAFAPRAIEWTLTTLINRRHEAARLGQQVEGLSGRKTTSDLADQVRLFGRTGSLSRR